MCLYKESNKVRVLVHRIVGYSQGKGTNIRVDCLIRLRQSSTDNQVWVEERVNATLAEYSALSADQGIFGHLPTGHEKNK